MRITNRGRYALRASLALAQLERNGSPVSINSLSEEENISSQFLEQIFFRLRKAGIVSSVRGPGGGFYFAQPLEKVTVKEILDAVGEDLELRSCDKGWDHAGACGRIGCRFCHSVWVDVTQILNDYFRNITLASILERSKAEPGKERINGRADTG